MKKGERYFTFTKGPDGASLRIAEVAGKRLGTLREITNAVAQLCRDEDEDPILEITSKTQVEGVSSEEILGKATELLKSKGYIDIRWMRE